MTIFDYLLNIALIALVVLQMRGRRLDIRGLLLPIGIVVWAASQYLHGIPTAGNDLLMVAAGLLAGVTLGTASALLTRVYAGSDGIPVAKATVAAAALWVLGIGARIGFSLYTSHGGGPTIARFSVAHHLTGEGWVTAIVLMAFAEVVSRTLVLWVRSRTVVTGRPAVSTVG
jgi:hypothetical protein